MEQRPPKPKKLKKVLKKLEQVDNKIAKEIQLVNNQQRFVNQRVQKQILPLIPEQKFRGKAPVRNQVLAYEEVAKSLVTPGRSTAMRWNSVYSGKKTAVAAPWAKPSAGWLSSGTQVRKQMPDTEVACVVRRCAECAIIKYEANPFAALFQYVFFGMAFATADNTTVPSSSWDLGIPVPEWVALLEPIYLKIPYANSVEDFSPHSVVWFGAKASHESKRYFWLDAFVTNTVEMTIAGLGAATTGFFFLDKWTPEGEVHGSYTATFTTAAPTAIITLTPGTTGGSGYYAMGVELTAGLFSTTPRVTSLKYLGTSSVYAHTPLPHFEKNVASVNGARVMGVSVMYTNTSSELNNQGNITALQVPEGTPWTQYLPLSLLGVTTSKFADISNDNDSETFDIKQGMYGFLKPTQNTDFKIQSYIETNGSVLVDSFWPLEDQSSYLVMYAQCNTAAGQVGLWTFNFSVDYQSIDVWRDVENPKFRARIYDDALEFVKTVQQFYTNKTHISDLWKTVMKAARKGVGFVNKYGPRVEALLN